MGFVMGDMVDAGFLDHFKGKVVDAGFVEGYIDASASMTGKAQVTHQLFLMIAPDDDPESPQPAWFSMGTKDWTLGGKKKVVTLGESETAMEVYPIIEDGPKITRRSQVGILQTRLVEAGIELPNESAMDCFGGVHGMWDRLYLKDGKEISEETAKKENPNAKPILMITEVYGKGKQKASTKKSESKDEEKEESKSEAKKSAGDDVKAMVADLVDGAEDSQLNRLGKSDEAKEAGLNSAKLMKIVDEMIEEGLLTKDEDEVYHKVEEE